MSLFSIAIMLKYQSLVVYLKISKAGENSSPAHVRQQYVRCNYTKFQLKIPIFLEYVLNFPRVPKFVPVLL